MWIVFAAGSAFFAGVTSILAKAGIKNVDSNLATALRTGVVLLFAWLMVFVTGGLDTWDAVTGKTLLFLILSGLTTGVSWLCYFRALWLGDVNKVVPIDKSSVILTMILAFIFLGEPLTWTMLIGMCGIGTGTYMMIQKKPQTGESIKKGGSLWFIYALGSAVFASLTSVLGKIGISGIDSNLGTAIRTIVVLVMAWLIVFITKKQKEIRQVDGRSWGFLLLSGVATGLSWLCYYRALQDGPASIVVPLDKLSILVSVVLAWIFFKEKLSPKAFLGLILVTAGTLILLV